jgi:hypothetical protein
MEARGARSSSQASDGLPTAPRSDVFVSTTEFAGLAIERIDNPGFAWNPRHDVAALTPATSREPFPHMRARARIGF